MQGELDSVRSTLLPTRHVILLRYDEIGLKGRNRRFFEDRLRENVAGALGRAAGGVLRERGRLFVPSQDGAPADGFTLRALGRVFGVRSFSPAVHVPREVPAILETVLRAADEGAARGASTFAIDARRSEKTFPATSLELNILLGRAVQERHPGLAVRLADPSLRIHVEVRRSGAYVYERVLPGPGGLPVGSSGPALLLLSGGIDSPVAGWMALKRGIELDAIHFHTPPYTAPQARDKAVALARELTGWRGAPSRTYLASLTPAQRAIGQSAPERLWTLIMRRLMVRVAGAVAERDGHGALVLGDSLGQVASQTLENIAAVDAAARLPILRPLVGFDKSEIVERARRIGTYALSVQPFEDCCTLFAPRRPATRARLEALEAAERELPLGDLVSETVAAMEVLRLEPAGGAQPWREGAAETVPATRVTRTRAMRMPSSSSTVNR